MNSKYRYLSNNFNSDVLRNFDLHLFDAIKNSIDNSDKESFDMLLSFISKAIFKCVRNNLVDTQHVYLNLLLRIYSYTQNKVSFSNDFIDKIPLNIRHILMFPDEENSNIEEKVVTTLSFITNLLRRQIDYNKFEDFKITLEKISLSFRHKSFVSSSYRPISKKGEFDAFLIRHISLVFLIIQSWLVVLTIHHKIKQEDLIRFSEAIKFPWIPYEELVNEFLLVRKNERIYDIENWDYTKRPEGIAYSPPTPHNWILHGFVLQSLKRHDLSNFTIKEIKNEDYSFIVESIEKELVYFKENLDFYKKIIFGASIADQKEDNEILELFDEKRKQIMFIFSSLNRRHRSKIEKEIAESKLSKTLISDYKKNVFTRWENTKNIYEVFKLFNNLEYISKDNNLLFIGSKIFFNKAKIMFVDKHHTPIFNTDLLGEEIKNGIENEFFKSLQEIDKSKCDLYNDPFEAAEIEIKKLKENNISPTLIIMPISYSYKSKLHEKFKPSWLEDQKHKDIFRFGYFDEIPIYGTYNKLFDNMIFVGDFCNSIQLRIYKNENLFKNLFHFHIRELTNEEVENKFESEKDSLKFDKNGIKLSNEEIRDIIRNAVMIEIWIKIDFSKLNSKYFSLAKIELKN